MARGDSFLLVLGNIPSLTRCFFGVKNIGKPCAGKLHARFDEGGQARACPLLYPFSLSMRCYIARPDASPFDASPYIARPDASPLAPLRLPALGALCLQEIGTAPLPRTHRRTHPARLSARGPHAHCARDDLPLGLPGCSPRRQLVAKPDRAPAHPAPPNALSHGTPAPHPRPGGDRGAQPARGPARTLRGLGR